MKYIKYVLVALVLLFLFFILLGVFKPTVNYSNEILVNKSFTECWLVSQDEEKMSEWLEGFIRMEHVSGTPGEVGAVSDVYFDNNGQEMTIRETITKIVPNESISMNFASDFMDMDYQISMEPEGDQTKISSSTSAKGNGMISKSIMALISGSLVAQEETNLANLKKTIENNTKNYSTEEVVDEELEEVSQ